MASNKASKRRTVLRRDQWTCVYCGWFDPSGESLTLDHIRPKSRGGRDANSNLATACRACNEAKADQDWGGTHWANLGRPLGLNVPDRVLTFDMPITQ